MNESTRNFPASLFNEFERLRQELDQVFDTFGLSSGIRSATPGTYPAINVGNTPGSVEIYAFAPGLDPSKIELTIDRGVLTISGERPSELPQDDRITVYGRERFSGSFRRTLSLPDDVDAQQVHAVYRDGVLQVSIARNESAQPKRIAIQ